MAGWLTKRHHLTSVSLSLLAQRQPGQGQAGQGQAGQGQPGQGQPGQGQPGQGQPGQASVITGPPACGR